MNRLSKKISLIVMLAVLIVLPTACGRATENGLKPVESEKSDVNVESKEPTSTPVVTPIITPEPTPEPTPEITPEQRICMFFQEHSDGPVVETDFLQWVKDKYGETVINTIAEQIENDNYTPDLWMETTKKTLYELQDEFYGIKIETKIVSKEAESTYEEGFLISAIDKNKKKLWTYETDMFPVGEYYASTYEIYNGEVYIFNVGRLVRINMITGKIIYQAKEKTIDDVDINFTFDDEGRIYGQGINNVVYKVNKYGKVMWSYEIDKLNWLCHYVSSIKVKDEKLYIEYSLGSDGAYESNAVIDIKNSRLIKYEQREIN